MANDQAPRVGGGTNFLIVGVSVLMIVALMAWLFMQEQSRAEATVAEGDTAAVAEAGPAGAAPAQTVNDTVFEQNVKTYVGQVVEITKVKFSSGLSSQTFWVELPTGQPFLVKLDSALVASGATPPTGGTLHIVGTVQSKDPALVAQWMQSGVLQNDDQKIQAEFGTTYMEARQIRPAGQ